MTKKHFIAIARALASVRPAERDKEAHSQWRLCVAEIAAVCKSQDAAFDFGRFQDACEK